MDKELIKGLIAEYQQFVKSVAFVKRAVTLSDNFNYVFVGLRRVGKSYLMYQQIHHLIETGISPEEILFFNFEDERIAGMDTEHLDMIKRCYEEMYSHRPIFFLDEIQIVPHWEQFVRRLADQKYRVYVTGSNAKMLSKDIATTLGGRFMIQYVYPFSFREYLSSNGVQLDKLWIYKNRSEVVRHFDTYFRFGGLPELLVAEGQEKRQWLSSLFNKIFFGDLVARYSIRNDMALKVLIRKLAESVKQPSSFTRLANLVSSTGKKITTDTIIDYLNYLEDTWIMFSLENYASKLADKVSNKKYYLMDNGILSLFLMDPETSLLENLVAVTLKKRYGDALYFYHRNIEVDFYLDEGHKAIQVSYSLKDPETRKREVNALLKLAENVAVDDLCIITRDEEEMIVEGEKTIRVVPVWRWLLDDEG